MEHPFFGKPVLPARAGRPLPLGIGRLLSYPRIFTPTVNYFSEISIRPLAGISNML